MTTTISDNASLYSVFSAFLSFNGFRFVAGSESRTLSLVITPFLPDSEVTLEVLSVEFDGGATVTLLTRFRLALTVRNIKALQTVITLKGPPKQQDIMKIA